MSLTATVNAVAMEKVQGSRVVITAPERTGQEFERWKIVQGPVILDDAASAVTGFTMPDGDVELEAVYRPMSCPCATMADVDKNAWYHEAVDYALTNGLMGGYNATTFGPNDNVTLEHLAVILWNYSGNAESVGTHSGWAANGLAWALENGILENVPYENVTVVATRAQTAQMLMN